MMNSIRCSETAIALVVLLAAVSGAAAQSVAPVDDSAPDTVKAGDEVEQVTYRIEDLFDNTKADAWKLTLSTELKDASWRIEYLNQGGATVAEHTPSGSSAAPDTEVTSDGSIVAIEVTVAGTAPAIEEYTYPEMETFTVMSVRRVGDGLDDEIKTVEAHHHTSGSKTARTQLDEAQTAIEAAKDRGAGVATAEETFDQAVQAYEDANFELAKELANEAENEAKGSEESQKLLTYGGIAIVVLLLVGGGVYVYRSRQSDYDELG